MHTINLNKPFKVIYRPTQYICGGHLGFSLFVHLKQIVSQINHIGCVRVYYVADHVIMH